MTTLLLMLLLGGAAGLLAGYLGIGGGVLLVPMFNEYLRLQGVGIDQATLIAAASSLAVTFLTAGAIAIERYRKGELVPAAIAPVMMGAVGGSFFGAWIASELPGKTIRVIFGLFMLMAAIQLTFQKSRPELQDHELKLNKVGLAALGVVTGIFSALLGIGGGVLMAPAFLLIFHFPWRKVAGTSSAIASLTSLIGVFGYVALSGERLGVTGPAWVVVDWYAAIPVALAGLVTARWGMHLSRRWGGVAYRRAFSLLLVVIAFRMLLPAR